MCYPSSRIILSPIIPVAHLLARRSRELRKRVRGGWLGRVGDNVDAPFVALVLRATSLFCRRPEGGHDAEGKRLKRRPDSSAPAARVGLKYNGTIHFP